MQNEIIDPAQDPSNPENMVNPKWARQIDSTITMRMSPPAISGSSQVTPPASPDATSAILAALSQLMPKPSAPNPDRPIPDSELTSQSDYLKFEAWAETRREFVARDLAARSADGGAKYRLLGVHPQWDAVMNSDLSRFVAIGHFEKFKAVDRGDGLEHHQVLSSFNARMRDFLRDHELIRDRREDLCPK
jgi:hypothetical protein